MEQPDLQHLLDKYKNGTCTAEESVLVENWYLQWKVQPQAVSEEELSNVKDELWQAIAAEVKAGKTVPLWRRVGIAAAIVLATISAGIWFYQSNLGNNAKTISYTSDVAPGSKGATLTLASGKKIRLDTADVGVLDTQSGLKISKSAEGKLIYQYAGNSDAAAEIHTLSTGKGESYQLVLPDSSVVWLNAATSLSFSTRIHSESRRKVELRGEGYFEVAKDRSRPFIVKSADQEIEVLGTHFNVNSYQEESGTKTTLMEGSVRVRQLANTGNQLVLKPNQQASMTPAGISVKYVDAADVIDWKNDGFIFNGGNFGVAMRKIARWYDVQIIYETEDLQNLEIGGFISRNNQLSAVLRFIESTGQVHFKIEGRRVFVTN
ncbi:FecR family protein [Pedobacter sp. GR22-6]|uniref:FecR family protein n=1 Tax=Pedobacter sp. GR22-6 TaxID=3127957 RepID=UPI00307EAB90